jgi:hypothetical protein
MKLRFLTEADFFWCFVGEKKAVIVGFADKILSGKVCPATPGKTKQLKKIHAEQLAYKTKTVDTEVSGDVTFGVSFPKNIFTRKTKIELFRMN